MPTKDPEVARAGRSQNRVKEGRDLIVSIMLGIRGRFPGLSEDKVDLGQREAGNLDTEVEIDEGLEFNREHFAVPARIQSKLVIRDDIGPALGGIEMG